MAEHPELGPALAPLQLGVGVRVGPQCMGHVIRTGVLEHPDDVTLQLDFKNILNSLHGDAMLHPIANGQPSC